MPAGCYDIKVFGGGWPQEIEWWVNLSSCSSGTDRIGKNPTDGRVCEGRELASGVGGADESQAPAVFCTECTAGNFLSLSSQVGGGAKEECSPCPTGTHSTNADSADCTACPRGKYADTAGMSECEECAAGKASPNQQVTSSSGCTACPAGTFSSSGAHQCTTCGDNLYSPSSGSSTCMQCPTGKFLSSADPALHKSESDCTPCAAGKSFNPATSSCVGCVAGKYGTVSQNCEYCESGKYSTEGTTTCIACSKGKYAPVYYGATECVECGAGSFADAGATACTNCPAGKYAQTAASEACDACPDHTVSNPVRTACAGCAAGFESTVFSSSSSSYYQCTPCQSGYVRLSSAALEDACTACPANTYSDDPSVPCSSCPANTVSEEGSVGCYKACDRGRVENPDNAECSCRPGQGYDETTDPALSCQPCAKGYFSEFYDATAPCTSCSTIIAGSVTYNVNSVSSSSCECPATFELVDGACLCGPGKSYDSSSNSCTSCTSGYKEQYGNVPCTSCGDRKSTGGRIGETTSENCECDYSFRPDADGACVCELGYGLVDSGGCDVCNPGFFKDELNTLPCSSCSSGTWSNTWRSASADDCNLCAPGRYNDDVAQTSPQDCVECAIGKYLADADDDAGPSHHDSSEDCLSCPEGHYGNAAGATQCHACAVGFYQDQIAAEGIESCQACAPGKLGTRSAATAETMCEACPPGSFSSDSGVSGSCSVCPAGKFNKDSGSSSFSSCMSCEAGTFLSDAGTDPMLHDGRDDCAPCPQGHYSNSTAASGCTECGAATYNEYEGADSHEYCLPCPAGSIGMAKMVGLDSIDKCIVCDKGTWSDAEGSITDCQECPTGRTTLPLGNSSMIAGLDNVAAFHNAADKCNVALPGYWIEITLEASEAAVACPGGKEACQENNECAPGYEDVRCAACAERFYSSGSGCFACKSNTTNWVPHVSFLAFVFFVVMIYYLNVKGIRTFLQQHFAKVTPKFYKIVYSVFKTHQKSMASKFKIALSYYQVVLLMGQVYSIEYPPEYEEFQHNFDWFGVNLAVEIDCYQKITYLMKLFATTAVPLLFCLMIAIPGTIGVWTTSDPEKKKMRKSCLMSGVLMITYLMLPTACLNIFQAFVCNEGVLTIDQTVKCDSSEYTQIRLYAVLMLVVWPIGVPFSYLYLLGSHYGPSSVEMQSKVKNFTSGRLRANTQASTTAELRSEEEEMKRYQDLDESAPKYLGVLNSEFEPQWWWMPVFEQYRKLSITGVTILLGTGSVDQLVAGMVIAVFAALVYFALQPYKDFMDDCFSMFAHFNVVLVLLCSLLVKFNKIAEVSGADLQTSLTPTVLSYILIMCNISVVIVFSLFMYIEFQALKKSVRARSLWNQLKQKGTVKAGIIHKIKALSGGEELDAVTEMESPLANFKFAVSPKKKKAEASKKKARGSVYEDGENVPAGRPPARRSVYEDGENLPAGRPPARTSIYEDGDMVPEGRPAAKPPSGPPPSGAKPPPSAKPPSGPPPGSPLGFLSPPGRTASGADQSRSRAVSSGGRGGGGRGG
jgi:hypothetical protein